MASLSVERIQAPAGGVCSDASPDYVPATQAATLVNLLPGRGKVSLRGPIRDRYLAVTHASAAIMAFWSWDSDFLVTAVDLAGTGVMTHRCRENLTKTDVTATLVEVPASSVHARYGAYVYGAIVDAASPQLGRWDGLASAIVPQANAPFQFTDLQVYMQRLFVLGGTLPGTTTPVINSSRVLFWSDPDPAADLSLLASWRDDTVAVPVINQLQYDGDDTPVGLAGCGKYMAILGSRSINILTGSGSSSFAVRNLSKNLGCADLRTIVEVDDGFYFMSDRGYHFCDGTTVQSVSDGAVSAELVKGLFQAQPQTAAMFGHGYLALCSPVSGVQYCWLFHIASRTWTQLQLDSAPLIGEVFRTNTYPLIRQVGDMHKASHVTNPADYALFGPDRAGSGDLLTAATWKSRFARLAAPGQVATLQRIFFEYQYFNEPAGATDLLGWRVRVLDTLGNVLLDQTATTQKVSSRRQRFQVECFAEADAVQLLVTNAAVGTTSPVTAEIYDAYIEFIPAQNRSSV